MFSTLALVVPLLTGDVAAPKPAPAPDKVDTKKAPEPAKPPAEAKPAAAVTFKDGLATPESVLYDAEADVYLVSSINGTPLTKDNNGYISVLSPEGAVVTPKLVEGGQKGVTLNAPKGLALVGGVLYVADIDTVRMFDRATGAPKGEVKLPGATFANDVFAGEGGKVYVTDSGLKQGAKDFEPTGTDALYVIEKGKAKALAKGKDLGKPNGVVESGGTLYLANFGNEELWALDAKGKKKGAVTKLPNGGLDGIVVLPGGDFLVSSWAASAVFQGKPGGEFKPVVSDVAAPADIGYDSKRNRLLIPRFMASTVEAWQLK